MNTKKLNKTIKGLKTEISILHDKIDDQNYKLDTINNRFIWKLKRIDFAKAIVLFSLCIMSVASIIYVYQVVFN